MSDESPLYRTRIACPVCKNENEFEAIKVGSYTESGRDTDFRPTGRKWRNPNFDGVDPLFYSVATCSSCYYTRELDGNYKNWPKDKRFTMYEQKPLREAHLKALATDGGVVRRLGSRLDLDAYPHETTINKLLLGVLDEELVESGESLNVARYYLRMAWLFRDLGVVTSTVNSRTRTASQVQAQISDLRQDMDRWVERARGVAKSIQGLKPATMSTDLRLGSVYEETTGLLAEWQATTEGVADETGPVVISPTSAAYFEHSSHRAFLNELRGTWDQVPCSEPEALSLALHHYIQYFEHCRSFPTPELEVQTAYLIGELGRRLSRNKDASGYFNLAIRKGHELIQTFQQDSQRVSYLRKLVEMSVEQGKKARDEKEVQDPA